MAHRKQEQKKKQINPQEGLRYSAFNNDPQGGNTARVVLHANGLEASMKIQQQGLLLLPVTCANLAS